MFFVKSSPRGHVCFRCLILSLSEPCEFLFYFLVLLPLGPEK